MLIVLYIFFISFTFKFLILMQLMFVIFLDNATV